MLSAYLYGETIVVRSFKERSTTSLSRVYLLPHLSTPVENSSFCRLKIPQPWSSGGLQFRLRRWNIDPAGEAEAGTAGVQPAEE